VVGEIFTDATGAWTLGIVGTGVPNVRATIALQRRIDDARAISIDVHALMVVLIRGIPLESGPVLVALATLPRVLEEVSFNK